MNQIKISDKILPVFYDFWRDCNGRKHLYKVLKGGRNSSKSTTIGDRIIFDMMRLPVNALCIRKVGNTLETSVYEQLKWAIEDLGVGAYWNINKSPLKLTYIPRGNSIIFRGADKPEKIKSIKTSKFPIAILWVEELPEFKTEEEISTIVNSVVRAELPEGLHYDIYYSYNPPKRKQSWVNKKFESNFLPDNCYVHHSTYLDNKYVSKAFIEEAEEVKKKNSFKYRYEYLGEPIGSGVVPFANLTFRKITDAEYKEADNIRQGCDWGYAADPFAFVRVHYDKTRRKLYFLDEIYDIKLSNRDAAARMKALGVDHSLTVADSSEPKSVSEMKGYGIRMKGAKKGPGSVEYGEKWLDDLDEIIIDPARTPHVAAEFEAIDYATGIDGEIKNRLVDKDNHTIDAVRYAMEDDMKKAASISW